MCVRAWTHSARSWQLQLHNTSSLSYILRPRSLVQGPVQQQMWVALLACCWPYWLVAGPAFVLQSDIWISAHTKTIDHSTKHTGMLLPQPPHSSLSGLLSPPTRSSTAAHSPTAPLRPPLRTPVPSVAPRPPVLASHVSPQTAGTSWRRTSSSSLTSSDWSRDCTVPCNTGSKSSMDHEIFYLR